MTKRAAVIAVCNQKGGVGKTTTTENLGIGLVSAGKRVLLIDADPQGSLTISLGEQRPDDLSPTLADLMGAAMESQPVQRREAIHTHAEGVDFIPANISLSGLEISLVNAMNREKILKQVIEPLRKEYDYILIDGMPSLGMLTINTLAASDSVLIPVQSQFLSAKGLEQLLQTVGKVKRQINPKLKIEGVLLTMVDQRTTYSREISELIREAYGGKIRVFDTEIPRSVRAAETSAEGRSIFRHDGKGKVAEAYRAMTDEVLAETQLRRQKQMEESI